MWIFNNKSEYPQLSSLEYKKINTWYSDSDIQIPLHLWRITQGLNNGYPYNFFILAEKSGYIHNPDFSLSSQRLLDYVNNTNSSFNHFDDKNTYVEKFNRKHGLSTVTQTKKYVIDDFYMSILFDYLKNIPSVIANKQFTNYNEIEKFLSETYLNSNPLDNVISLKQYVYNVKDRLFSNTARLENVKISNDYVALKNETITVYCRGYTDSIEYRLTTVNYAHITVHKAFNDFRDYSDFTEVYLYTPYCQLIKLNIDEILEHTIYIKYLIDNVTGESTCSITLDGYDGIEIAKTSCMLAYNVAVTALQSSDLYNQTYNNIQAVKNANLNIFATIAKDISSIVTNPTNAINLAGDFAKNELTLKQAQYNLKHTQYQYNTFNSNESLVNNLDYMQAYLFVSRSEIDTFNVENYRKLVGVACLEYDKLKNFSGFTVADSVKLDGINALTAEKNAIENLLKSGVYINVL